MIHFYMKPFKSFIKNLQDSDDVCMRKSKTLSRDDRLNEVVVTDGTTANIYNGSSYVKNVTTFLRKQIEL